MIDLDVMKNLYASAVEFQKLNPWHFIPEEDIFGIQNPWTSEFAYCTIMGGMAEHFALAVYLNGQGLRSLFSIKEAIVNDVDAYVSQYCLMLSFEDRSFLSKPDLDLIKSLALKFRGKKNYPMFRFHNPGYDPEPLDKDQAKFLLLVLDKAIDVITSGNLVSQSFAGKDAKIPVYYSKLKNGEADWSLKYQELILPAQEVKVFEIDDFTVQRIRKLSKQSNATWLLDYFYFMATIKEPGKRAYYPRAVMIADEKTGMVLGLELFQNEVYSPCFQTFLKSFEAHSVRPKVICVRREDVYHSLSVVCDKLKIQLKLVEDLSLLDQIKSHVEQYGS